MTTPTVTRDSSVDRAAPSRRWTRGRLEVLGAFVFYTLFAFAVTWPLVLDPGGKVFGGLGGDLTGGVSVLREIVEHRVFPFAPGTLPEYDAPFGQPVPWALNLATFPSMAILTVLGYAFGATAAYAIFAWMAMVGSATSMFLLARRLTGSSAAALVAGLGFGFFPFAVNKAWGHPHFAHGWVFVLMTWRLLELGRKPTLRNGVWAGAATAFAMWFTPYFILFGAVLLVVVGAVLLAAGVLRGDGRRTLTALAACGAVVFVFLLALGGLQVAGGGGAAGGTLSNPLQHLFTYSARPHELLLPDRNNPLFGAETEPYLTEHLHGSNFSESSLYLGISLLLLALGGAFLTVWAIVRRRREAAADPRVVGGVAAGLTVIVAGLFALPPQVGVFGQLVDLPMWYVFQVTSTFRAVSRFVTLIELGVCLLAALGLAALLARRAVWPKAAITTAVLAIVAVDLWARPPDPVIALTAPKIYDELKKLGPGGVVEYPVYNALYPSSLALTYQDAHGHPLFQGYAGSTESESRKLELADLGDAETAGGLAALGMKWVYVRPDEPSKPASGFRPVYSDESGSIYQVTAKPSRTQVDAIEGFEPPEGVSNSYFRWMTGQDGKLLVMARGCDPCRGVLRFRGASVSYPRELIVRDARGRELHRQELPAGDLAPVEVPLEFDGRTVVTLHVTPGPEATELPDTRTLAIRVLQPRFRLAP